MALKPDWPGVICLRMELSLSVAIVNIGNCIWESLKEWRNWGKRGVYEGNSSGESVEMPRFGATGAPRSESCTSKVVSHHICSHRDGERRMGGDSSMKRKRIFVEVG